MPSGALAPLLAAGLLNRSSESSLNKLAGCLAGAGAAALAASAARRSASSRSSSCHTRATQRTAVARAACERRPVRIAIWLPVGRTLALAAAKRSVSLVVSNMDVLAGLGLPPPRSASKSSSTTGAACHTRASRMANHR